MITIATIHALMESFEHIAGFLFVMFVLTLLWLVIAAMGTLFSKREKKAASAKAVPASAPSGASPAADSDEISEEDLVVIAATATLMLGRRSRLVSIRPASLDWGREGRRQHVMSHATRR